MTAYFLKDKYEIHIFEKQAILGGNVRTLNKNVKNTSLPDHLQIENGVLGFSQNYYPQFHKLLRHLEVHYRSFKPSISLFAEGDFYPARTKSYLSLKVIKHLLFNAKYRQQVLQLQGSQSNFQSQIIRSKTSHLNFKNFSFDQKLYHNYMKSLFMLSFSTPFSLVNQLPQTLLNAYFLSLPNSKWSAIEGGVYSYMDRILKKSNFKVFCNAENIKVTRHKKGVSLKIGAELLNYDKVIIATTPGSVKSLLTDKSSAEEKVFADWQNQSFKTIAHTDVSFYKDYFNVRKTPMDLFYDSNDGRQGYNTYQNLFYNLKSKTPYCFAYNLDKYISKKHVLHMCRHTVPKYTSDHDSKVSMLQQINGRQNTYFCGAYLDNGLHEGAVNSALKISKALGGMSF